jgi:L-rhamnose mutarotase
MIRNAFKMKLHAGFEVEYKKRHDEIWPELSQVLKDAGVSDYSIFLDSETLTLFASWIQQCKYGGLIWLISWKQMLIIHLSVRPWMKSFI